MAVLNHPETDPDMDPIIYQNHVPTDNGTAGYSDVRKVLAAIKDLVVVGLGVAVAFVVGDQQSFSRMVWLLRKEHESYGFIIPLYGDFHFAVHLLQAIHSLWWGKLIEQLLGRSGFQIQSIEKDWKGVELYNRYRFTYEALIVGMLQYLNEALPGRLSDPATLLAAAEARNKGDCASAGVENAFTASHLGSYFNGPLLLPFLPPRP